MKLPLEDIGISVNKTVIESQTQQKRRKKVELPSTNDIKKLFTFLNEKRNSAYQSLERKFTFQSWLSLAETTLSSMQVHERTIK